MWLLLVVGALWERVAVTGDGGLLPRTSRKDVHMKTGPGWRTEPEEKLETREAPEAPVPMPEPAAARPEHSASRKHGASGPDSTFRHEVPLKAAKVISVEAAPLPVAVAALEVDEQNATQGDASRGRDTARGQSRAAAKAPQQPAKLYGEEQVQAAGDKAPLAEENAELRAELAKARNELASVSARGVGASLSHAWEAGSPGAAEAEEAGAAENRSATAGQEAGEPDARSARQFTTSSLVATEREHGEATPVTTPSFATESEQGEAQSATEVELAESEIGIPKVHEVVSNGEAAGAAAAAEAEEDAREAAAAATVLVDKAEAAAAAEAVALVDKAGAAAAAEAVALVDKAGAAAAAEAETVTAKAKALSDEVDSSRAVTEARARGLCPRGLLGYLCAALAAIACVQYLKKKCVGEESCWYTVPFCKKLRLRMGLDEAPTFQIHCQVHKAKDLGSDGIYICIQPRRGGVSKNLKVKAKKASMTAVTNDQRWEQHLQVPVDQGSTVLQVGAFKAKSGLWQTSQQPGDGTPLGWGSVSVKDLLSSSTPPFVRKWVQLFDAKGVVVGQVQLTLLVPEAVEKRKSTIQKTATMGSMHEAGSVTEGTPREPKATIKAAKAPTPLDLSMPSVEGLSDTEAVKVYAEALTCPLNLANKLGEYHGRYFRIEEKHKIWLWAWYKEKRPGPGDKPIGRFPLLSIACVLEVPNSISEFVVRYRDSAGEAVDMRLQRTTQPREWYVKTVYALVRLLREMKKKDRRAAKAGGSSAAESSDE